MTPEIWKSVRYDCFNWGYPYSQMLHNIKWCILTTKIDKRETIS